MSLKLEPHKTESHIFIQGKADKRWSLLTPECIACREWAAIHCHVKPPRWTKTSSGWTLKQRLSDNPASYTCTFRPLGEDVVELVFVLKNEGNLPMTDAEADFCFACAGAAWSTGPEHVDASWVNSAFHGARKERNIDWTKRSFVATEWGLIPVGDIDLHYPVAVNRKVAGKNISDIPVIICQSEDRKEVYAAGWEVCARLFCAMGSCIHTTVWFGTIARGNEVRRRGRFYYMKTDPYRLLARFQRDFGV